MKIKVFRGQLLANENRCCKWKWRHEYLEFSQLPMKISITSENEDSIIWSSVDCQWKLASQVEMKIRASITKDSWYTGTKSHFLTHVPPAEMPRGNHRWEEGWVTPAETAWVGLHSHWAWRPTSWMSLRWTFPPAPDAVAEQKWTLFNYHCNNSSQFYSAVCHW